MPRASKTGASKKVGAKPTPKKRSAAKSPTKRAAAPSVAAAPAKKAQAGTKRPSTATAKAPSRSRARKDDGLDKFLLEQRASLEAERATYEAQAAALKAEADQMAQEAEPGDVQFDDESGEGGTVNIDRERDLALSAQARAAVEDIDHALGKIVSGTYGACEMCGQPIPRARLKALPHARLCVGCKSGGLSRR